MSIINGGIYAILNLINDKYYIGSAKNFYKRWHIHKTMLRGNYHDNSYLQKAWNKYGEINFIFVILEETVNLLEKEQHWIDILCIDKTYSYNLRKLANTNLGIKFSEEAKLKISIAKKGTKVSEETKIKLSIAHKNRPPISQETRNKLRLSKLNQSEETKRKISQTKTGVLKSLETREKMKLGWMKRKARLLQSDQLS